MSQDILFLAHRLPFPPDRGDKIRSHHILQRLARIAPVHVATFADDPGDLAHEGMLAGLARSYCLRVRSKPLWRAGLEAVFKREPVSVAAFRDENIARYVRDVIATGTIGSIYVFSGQMGQYVPDDFSGRVLMDLVDVDSAKFDAYAMEGGFPRRLIDAREGRLLRIEEERLGRRSCETLLVSEAEAALFRSRLADPAGVTVLALCNGIDAEFFDPADEVGHLPSSFAGTSGPNIVFTGQMDYAPNIAAAERLIQRILPGLRARFPHAECHIVGRNPPPVLCAFDGHDGVRVWGSVPDVRPFVGAADLVVVPLDIARGVQNKVLEAMAMARPIVLTSGAATGIGARDNIHFAVADDDADLIRRASELLGRPELGARMGTAARQYVIENLGWDAVLQRLEGLISPSATHVNRRDAA